MTVYLPKGGITWWYDFRWRGQRYRESTKQLRQADAELVESQMKLRLRQEAGGVAAWDPDRTPRFQDWAERYYLEAAKRVSRPDRVETLLRVVLCFWGSPPRPDPKNPRLKVVEGEPYHNLRLGEAIADPHWIVEFETWMERRGVAGQTKNQYRSTLNGMYKLAMRPEWRKRTGITANPFAGIGRDPSIGRLVTLSVEDLRRWVAAMSYHTRLACALGALAPKLRLDNILHLRWTEHLDRGWQWITVYEHKTARRTGKPLVVPVTEQLRRVLLDARRRNRGDYVIAYRGRPLRTIRNGLKAAATRAGLRYGRFEEEGITFHTLRHSIATLLAERGDVAEGMRKELMGHESLATTQKYTHIRPTPQRGPLEQLSHDVPLEDLVTLPHRRAKKVVAGAFGKS